MNESSIPVRSQFLVAADEEEVEMLEEEVLEVLEVVEVVEEEGGI